MSRLFVGGVVVAATALLAVAVHAQGGGGAQAIENPVPPVATSITAGEAAFKKDCAFCHGVDAKGNGPLAPEGSNPPDLTDETWTYGSTDGEIFSVMADGLDGSVMIPIRGRMPDDDLWHIINYLRSLGPQDGAAGAFQRSVYRARGQCAECARRCAGPERWPLLHAAV